MLAVGARWLRCLSCCFHSRCRSPSCSLSRCGCWSHPSIDRLLHCYCCCYRRGSQIILNCLQIVCSALLVKGSIEHNNNCIMTHLKCCLVHVVHPKIPHNSKQTPWPTSYQSDKDTFFYVAHVWRLLTYFFTLQDLPRLWRNSVNCVSIKIITSSPKLGNLSFTKGSTVTNHMVQKHPTLQHKLIIYLIYIKNRWPTTDHLWV